MGKKQALKSFKSLKDKLEAKTSETFFASLADTVKKYLGDDSHFYTYLKSFHTQFGFNRENASHKEAITNTINDCIEFIKMNGVKKESSFFKWIQSLNQSLLWTIITGIVGVIFLVGFIIGRFTSLNSQYDEALKMLIN